MDSAKFVPAQWERVIAMAVHSATHKFKALNALTTVPLGRYMATVAAAAASAFFVTIPKVRFNRYAARLGLLDDCAVAVCADDLNSGATDLSSNMTAPPSTL